MTNLINPKPRFGFNTDSQAIYDYVTQRDVAVSTSYAAPDGVWDLTKVRDLILGGQPIEAARLSVSNQVVSAKPAAVQAAAPGYSATGGVPSQVAHNAAAGVSNKPPKFLSSSELKELGLTPIQLASLRITPVMLANGLNWGQIQSLKLSASRARMLGLTDAQASALES